jgi:acetone carboxylase gamma subunit
MSTEKANQKENFTCVIEDQTSQDRFSAKVTINKRIPVRLTRLRDQVALADIYIAPISDQLFIYGNKPIGKRAGNVQCPDEGNNWGT